MAFKRLIKGYRKFQAAHFAGESELFEQLALGQSPETMVIACSDSRIDPAILTQGQAGDIFSVRNVAAMVSPAGDEEGDHNTAAAVEYAVNVLKVKHVVVMGHALCGGIRALADSHKQKRVKKSFVSRWIAKGAATRDKVMTTLSGKTEEAQLRALEQATILTSLANLLSYSCVKNAVDSGALHLHGWYFDIVNGQLLSYNPKTRHFEDILVRKLAPSVSAEMCGCGETTLSVTKFVNQIKKTAATQTARIGGMVTASSLAMFEDLAPVISSVL